MKISSNFHSFFSKNLKKYIDEQIYRPTNSEKIFKIVDFIDSKSCRKWDKLPLSYLGPTEALAVGIVIAFEGGGQRLSNAHTFKRVIEYFLSTLQNTKFGQKSHSLASTCLGVCFLEKALLESRNRQRKYLFLARHYLEESQTSINQMEYETMAIHMEINYIYQALVEVCLNNLEGGIKNLQKAARLSRNSPPLWMILSNIYKNLGQQRLQTFFYRRYEKALQQNNYQTQSYAA